MNASICGYYMVHTNKKDIQLCYNVHQKEGGGPSRTGEIPVPAVKVRNPWPATRVELVEFQHRRLKVRTGVGHALRPSTAEK